MGVASGFNSLCARKTRVLSVNELKILWGSSKLPCEHYAGCPHMELLLAAKKSLTSVLTENERLKKNLGRYDSLKEEKRALEAQITSVSSVQLRL